MPFDGLSVNQDMLVIDRMLEIFSPNGEHWIQGFEYDPAGSGCLVGGRCRRSCADLNWL
jgi:hypothetical protein